MELSATTLMGIVVACVMIGIFLAAISYLCCWSTKDRGDSSSETFLRDKPRDIEDHIVREQPTYFTNTPSVDFIDEIQFFRNKTKPIPLPWVSKYQQKPEIDKNETLQKLSSFELHASKILADLGKISQEVYETAEDTTSNSTNTYEELELLSKRLKSVHEECMRGLEYLDGIQLTAEPGSEAHSFQRTKRKASVQYIQDLLTKHDELHQKLQELNALNECHDVS